jgi:uncharacterized membrane protein
MALNEISKVLRQIARRELPKHVLSDKQDKPRIIADVPTFEHLAAQAFDQIRRYGMSDAIIPAKMLDVITEIAEEAHLESERAVLREHVLAIVEDAGRAFENSRDRIVISAELQPALRALGMSETDVHLQNLE